MNDPSGAARIRILSGPDKGRIVAIEGDQLTIGRNPGSDLVIGDPQVSARHARFTPVADGVLIEDLGSTNGTLVNGQAIVGPRLLQGGERLQLGDTHLTLTVPWLVPASSAGAGSMGPSGLSQEAVRPLPGEGTSTMERRRLVREVNRSFVLAAVAVVVSVAVLAVLFSGVLNRSKPGPPTAAQIVSAVAPATVLIQSLRDGHPIASGTGWALDAGAGLITTNYHVIRDATAFQVTVGNQARPATVVGAAPCDDIAVLKVADASALRTMALGSQSDLALGDPVVAVGYPVNASRRDQLTATTGVVSVVRSRVDGRGESPSLPDVVQTDAPINPGNSGGPLVSSRKVLIGMNTLTLVSANGQTLQNSNYAIGVDQIKAVTATLRQGRSLGWTGASLTTPAEAADLVSLGLPSRPGLLIDSAVPGTPADKAGLGRTPALLVAVDGHAVDANMTSYCDAVKDARSGQTVQFTVYRPQVLTTIDIPVTLA